MTRETVIRQSAHVILFTFFTVCHIQYIPSTPLFKTSWTSQGLPLYKCLLHSLGLSLSLWPQQVQRYKFVLDDRGPRIEYLLAPVEPAAMETTPVAHKLCLCRGGTGSSIINDMHDALVHLPAPRKTHIEDSALFWRPGHGHPS